MIMSKFNEAYEQIMNEMSDKYNVYTKRNGKWDMMNSKILSKDEARQMIKDIEKGGIKSITDVELVHDKAKPPTY